MLFVPASYDFSRSLEDQGEHLWWSDRPYDPAAYLGDASYKVVRGFDATRGGIQTDGLALTLDGGCGAGGPLVCGCFNAAGQLLEIITVGGQQAGQFAGELNRAARAPSILQMPLHQPTYQPLAVYA